MSGDRLRAAALVVRGEAERNPGPGDVIGRALAGWLDHAAEACGLGRTPYLDQDHAHAHSVADAILGDET